MEYIVPTQLIILLLSGLSGGLTFGLVFGLVETRPLLIGSRTPSEARSRSLITALLYVLFTALPFGLFIGLTWVLSWSLTMGQTVMESLKGLLVGLLFGLVLGLIAGLCVGLFLGLNNGGWFVLLQKVAHRRLARAGNLPPRPYDFLEWGIEQQIFRQVGGGVRFRHNLIQEHLANTTEDGS